MIPQEAVIAVGFHKFHHLGTFRAPIHQIPHKIHLIRAARRDRLQQDHQCIVMAMDISDKDATLLGFGFRTGAMKGHRFSSDGARNDDRST